MRPALQFYPKRISLLCKQSLITIVLFFSFTNATVFDFIIQGKLVNEKGKPIHYASVIIKETSLGVQTGLDGTFSLKSANLPVTIVCSALGYEQVEKTIAKNVVKDSVAVVVVHMKKAGDKLEEVVVVGYAATKKSSMTGSVSSIRSSSMAGKVPGVTTSAAHDAMATRSKKEVALFSKEIAGKEAEKTGVLSITKEKTGVKRTSLLTAGEVNDFRKWKMWEDYNETDFKTHSDKWKLYATRRYSVQLQNSEFKALTGQRVFLVNKQNGDTLWTAMSDNTGKAELWKGFNSRQQDNDLLIVVEKETKLFPAVPFTQGINKIVLNRNCEVSNKVEIAFVVDATGSMQDEIEYLKEELGDILTKVAKKDPSLDLHTGSVFYRDKGDAYVTNVQPMTPGITNTIGFIKKQHADGGGDFPEALKEALQDATSKLKWSKDARTKIIFLVIDAPPHDDARAEMAAIISNAASMGIRIVPVACSGTDKATEFIMRSMALATNGTYLFLTDDSGIGNPHIKPTTDEFKVELLNDLMQRTIEQMCFMKDCSAKTTGDEPLTFYTNTGKVKLFPNPTKGPVVVETSKELTEIFVADFTGKILLRKELKDKSRKYSLDLSAFPSATYFIRYTTKENKTGAEKLVVAR